MTDAQLLLLADIVLVAHFIIAVFITYSLPLIWIGALAGWRFVRNPWFRFSHAGLMGVVLLESLVGMLCPLTTWEATLRRSAGAGTAGDGQSFVAHWMGRLLFHDFDEWVFTLAYGLFFAAVTATFFLVPVERRSEKREKTS